MFTLVVTGDILGGKSEKMCSCSKQGDQQALESGSNFALLFGGQAGGNVLLIGSQLPSWKEIFPHAEHWDHVLEKGDDHVPFDLVLFHSDCATSRARLIKELNILKSYIKPNGMLLLFAENFFSFTNIQQIKRKNWKALSSQLRIGLKGYKKVLLDSGFQVSQGYLVLPNLQSPEEMVSLDSSLLEIPCNSHVLLRLAHHFKLFKYITDGYLFINTCNLLHPIEETPLLRNVARQLQASGHIQATSCRLERFDLRMRGAMVLFLSERVSGKKFVVRVVNDSRTQVIVRRNEQFVQWLLSRQSLNENIKQQLPCPISSFEFAGSGVFIETQVKGVLAWKVNAPDLRDEIFQGSCDFIFQLQQGTRSQTIVDQDVFQKLFNPVRDRLESCEGAILSFLYDVHRVVDKIEHKVLGKSCILTASHGDYGYGNILVDPRLGKLLGVIDWDTGRHLEFAGLDFFNLLVQRGRTEKKYGVYQAFSSAVSDIVLRGSLDDAYVYGREFGVSGDSLALLLYIGFLRYVSRSAQYPKVYNAEQDDYIKIIQLLKTEVPL